MHQPCLQDMKANLAEMLDSNRLGTYTSYHGYLAVLWLRSGSGGIIKRRDGRQANGGLSLLNQKSPWLAALCSN